MNENYLVVNWDTNEIIKEFDDLNQAKKFCRNLGHKEASEIYTSYPPIAFVGKWITIYDNPAIGLVYNPRFPFEKE